MADESKAEAKRGTLLGQIFTSVAVAILVGGTSPWWFNALVNKPAVKAPDVVAVPQKDAVSPSSQEPTETPQEKTPVASREFFVGRWQANQEVNGQSTTNVVEYYDNGKFDGHSLAVYGNLGQRANESGSWEVEPLSSQSFRLALQFDNGVQWTGQFRIIDRNHIHNINENYIAERLE